MEAVRVALGARSYDILVGGGLIGTAGSLIERALGRRRVIVITDRTVGDLYLSTLADGLTAGGFAVEPPLVVPPGERAKSLAHYGTLVEALLGRLIDRRTVILALGGGVVGDLAGFVAATALRGLDFVQIPTTLLAQVDSSVGGKTGINSDQGKNLIGAFHQPRLVIADLDTLDTLPVRALRAGYAEVVKYALIDDAALFDRLVTDGPAVCRGDQAARRRAVVASCRAKAAIVADDEREAGRRALLNLGHTFGHALETVCGYGDRLFHGEAVAIGLVLACALSVRLGMMPAGEARAVDRHLAEIGLPTAVAPLVAAQSAVGGAAGPGGGDRVDTDRLFAVMQADKKVRDGRITFVLMRGIGRAELVPAVDPAVVRGLLADAVAGRPLIADDA